MSRKKEESPEIREMKKRAESIMSLYRKTGNDAFRLRAEAIILEMSRMR